MPSLVDRKIAEIGDRVWGEITSPGGWLYEQIRLHVRWVREGFEPGYGIKQRAAFTATVADRIEEKARQRKMFLGIPLWLEPCPRQWCEEEAERIVTDWLQIEQIKFGDVRYFWFDGAELADEDMSYWESV